MKIPSTINLLGFDFDIIEKPKNKCSCPKCKTKFSGCLSKKEIILDKSKSHQEKVLIIFHELGHFFSRYYNIERDSEIFAESFARYLYSINEQMGALK